MRIALGQIDIGDDPAANLARVAETLKQVGPVDLAVFPEAAMARFGGDLAAVAQPLDGEFVTGLRRAARDAATAVVAGVFEPAGHDRVHNTAVAIDAAGELVGHYRKIHLFDAFGYRESDTVAAGRHPVVVELAGVRIGLATCYDLRFPELFRALTDQGAQLFAVIAAWTPGVLKEEHWTTLVRARAIENTTWTVAVGKPPDATPPARGGPTGIGRSLLVDPMGAVRADAGPFGCVQVVELDLGLTEKVRRILPSLEHRRLR